MCLAYFVVLQWLPIGSLGKKASLWCILGVPSIWWIDLQVDGVRKGYVFCLSSSSWVILMEIGRFRNSRKLAFRVPGRSSHRPSPPRSTQCIWRPYSTRSSLLRIRILGAWKRFPCYRPFFVHLPHRGRHLCRAHEWLTYRRCWTNIRIPR